MSHKYHVSRLNNFSGNSDKTQRICIRTTRGSRVESHPPRVVLVVEGRGWNRGSPADPDVQGRLRSRRSTTRRPMVVAVCSSWDLGLTGYGSSDNNESSVPLKEWQRTFSPIFSP